MKKTGITTACICLTLMTTFSAYAQDIAAFLASMEQAKKPATYLRSEPLYECIYSFDINCDVHEVYSVVLQMGKDFNRFYDYTAFAVDSLSFSPDASADDVDQLEERRLTSMFYFDSEVWQGLPDNAMTVVVEASPNFMSYEEELGAMEWTMEEGSETVCGYLCSKATTTYGGRDWTVWYAPDIPSTAGPWKFNGLPGLILAAKDSESLFEFKAITFRKGVVPVLKKEDSTIHQSTREKVLKAKIVAENDVQNGKMPGPSEVRFISIHRTSDGNNIVYINGAARRPRPNGYQPLELE